MNVFVVTNDNFFYLGMKKGLANKGFSVSKIDPLALDIEQLRDSMTSDVFVFYKSYCDVELSLLISTETFPGRLIFILDRRIVNWTHHVGQHIVFSVDINIDTLCIAIINNEKVSEYISSRLTNREVIVLHHTIQGMNASTISRFLQILPKTVYAHRRNAFIKLGVRNLFEVWAVRERLLYS